jgi:hypothetical protein
MPTYNFRDEENNVEFEEFMTMSEREAFLSDHPHIKQLPPSQMITKKGQLCTTLMYLL